MKKVLCNSVEPPLTKLASASGNEITGIKREGRVWRCSLNGKRMSTAEARNWLLDNYEFVDHNGNPLRLQKVTERGTR